MAFVISDGCVDVKDKACMTDCPVDCIYEGGRMTYIHPLECIDCGACAPLCPQDAIYYEKDLPEDLHRYARVNAEFFADLDYADDGRLIITREHPAMDPAACAEAARRAVVEGRLVTVGGHELPVRAETVCVHSDTPNAVAIAAAVREALAPHLEA